MHISAYFSDIQQAILKKCPKMTEEGGHRTTTTTRHGLNGNVAIKEEADTKPTSYVQQGGRLKFFKDGKFILELERAREGERVSWVSVPRKTFWPPQGTAASTPTYRQESSTSLSVSDDNSSIQSSPWQRDHSWKQSSPRKNFAQQFALYFWRPKSQRCCQNVPGNNGKRRKPYSTEQTNDQHKNKKTSECTDNKKVKQRPLLAIVQSLIERNNCRTSTPPRPDVVVSPRKRFLREMEKDSRSPLEESKRCRNKQPLKMTNGAAADELVSKTVTAPQRNCSYSITSLLADDRKQQRSPPIVPPTAAQFCSDDRWYSESVDKLRSIELSQQQVDKRSVYPQYQPQPPPYLPAYMYNPFPPYYGAYRGGGGGGAAGYMIPSLYHTQSSPLSLPIVRPPPNVPSCSWSAEPSDRDSNVERRATAVDESTTITDMPLNLSKHAG